jgi:hypothetical protein
MSIGEPEKLTMTVSPTRKRATAAAASGGAVTGAAAAAGLATVRGCGLSEKTGLCDGELQPAKIMPATSPAPANNPRTNKFMGTNPCENAGAINTFECLFTLLYWAFVTLVCFMFAL